VFTVNKSNINLFADDTLIWVASDSIETATNLIQSDLENIERFLQMTKLKLNAMKTKYMVFNSRRGSETEIKLGNVPIERVVSIKYLGVIIDQSLKFSENSANIVKKMSSKVGFITRNKRKFDRETRLILYKSIVAPQIDYCSSILMLANQSEIYELQKVQNRAMRLILDADRYMRIGDMLAATKLLDVKQRLIYNVLVLMYKIKNNLLPSYLCSMLQTVGDSQPYNLRNNNDFRPPVFRTHSAQNLMIYKGSSVFNDMMNKKFNVNGSISVFKSECLNYVKTYHRSH